MITGVKPFFGLLAALGLSGCASTGATPRPFPMPEASPATRQPRDQPTAPEPGAGDPVAAAHDGYAISSTALSLRGVPYRNGGSDPSGFDCSGFVRYVFEQHGLGLPRDTRRQFAAGVEVDAGQLEPGDLLFFTTVAPGASHVGIAIGGDQFVHAPSSQGVVRVEQLSAVYWASRFVGAKRLF